jgi:hypothetical protein
MDKKIQLNSEFGIEFRILVTTDRIFQTPAAPRSVVMRPVKDVDPTIHPDRQFKYRLGVGMLMYLVQHSSLILLMQHES